MSQFPSLGRPRSQVSSRVPPQVAITPSPPLSDSDPGSDFFDPNRTPPPPAPAIFGPAIPEEKCFEPTPSPRRSALNPPPRSVPQPLAQVHHRGPRRALRPLTGRPPAPPLHKGIRRAPAPRVPRQVVQPQAAAPRTQVRPAQAAATAQPAASVPAAAQNPLDLIHTTLLKIQSYIGTLSAASSQRTSWTPHQSPQATPGIPRATPNPSSPPATLADLISSPQPSRKR